MIRYSRHAKQRLKLYKIQREHIEAILAADGAENQPLHHRRELIAFNYVAQYGHPLFVAYVRELTGITVVTIFPYDRETNYEDIIR